MPQGILLEHLRRVKNLSGAIPSAPFAISEIKNAVRTLPSDVQAPAMSTLVSVENAIPGLLNFVEQMGSVSALGDFKSILSRLQSLGIDQDLKNLDPKMVSELLRTVITPEEMKRLVGPATAIMASIDSVTKRG